LLTAGFALFQGYRAWRDRSWTGFSSAAFAVLMFYLLGTVLWFMPWYANLAAQPCAVAAFAALDPAGAHFWLLDPAAAVPGRATVAVGLPSAGQLAATGADRHHLCRSLALRAVCPAEMARRVGYPRACGGSRAHCGDTLRPALKCRVKQGPGFDQPLRPETGFRPSVTRGVVRSRARSPAERRAAL